MEKKRRCIVRNCKNSVGKSVPSRLCFPCYKFITMGEGRLSQAYRNALEVGISAVVESVVDGAVNLADPTRTVGLKVVPR